MNDQATLADLLAPAGRLHPAVTLLDNDHSTTYQDLTSQVEATASWLRSTSLQPGQAVAIVLPNGLEYLVAFLAVARARLIAAPLNPAYKSDEYRFFLEDAGVRAVIAPLEAHSIHDVARDLNMPVWRASRDGGNQVQLSGEGLPDPFAGYPELPRPEDIALFLHTSGTTSRPKGVPLTHANLMASADHIANHYQLSPEDTNLVVMPLFHVHGLIGATLSTLLTGGTVVVPGRFSAAAFWPAVQAHQVTWYTAVPTIHQILLARADADNAPTESGLRFIRSCSSALAPATLAQLEDRFSAPVLEAYGMTEAAHQMASNPLPPAVRKPGTVGQGTRVEVGIMDDASNLLRSGTPGEVVVRGPNVTRGYHNNPEANAACFTGGWFRTGDRGVLDAEGYLTLIGRIKELINRGGEKISPLEVDAALLTHAAVAEAATFGAADAKYGEVVHAAVVLKAEVTPAELQNHCRERLADFKVPEQIHLLQQLPKGPTGKIQRRHLGASILSAT